MIPPSTGSVLDLATRYDLLVEATSARAVGIFIRMPIEIDAFFKGNSRSLCIELGVPDQQRLPIEAALRGVQTSLWPPLDSGSDPRVSRLVQDMNSYASQLLTAAHNPDLTVPPWKQLAVPFLPGPTRVEALTARYLLLLQAQGLLPGSVVPPTPASIEAFFGIIAQEICVQQTGESRRRALVGAMAPSCLARGAALTTVETIARQG